MNGGWRPTFMERVEAYLTLRTSATALTVSALDGAGNATGTLPASEVQAVAGGYRIHVNGDGQPQTPWFAITAALPPMPSLTADPNPIVVADPDTLGQTTLTWNAPGYDNVEVHVNAADGPKLAGGGPTGTAATGRWVTDGTVFYLTGAPTGETLATVTVRVLAP
jgi:hypothetical protein